MKLFLENNKHFKKSCNFFWAHPVIYFESFWQLWKCFFFPLEHLLSRQDKWSHHYLIVWLLPFMLSLWVEQPLSVLNICPCIKTPWIYKSHLTGCGPVKQNGCVVDGLSGHTGGMERWASQSNSWRHLSWSIAHIIVHQQLVFIPRVSAKTQKHHLCTDNNNYI